MRTDAAGSGHLSGATVVAPALGHEAALIGEVAFAVALSVAGNTSPVATALRTISDQPTSRLEEVAPTRFTAAEARPRRFLQGKEDLREEELREGAVRSLFRPEDPFVGGPVVPVMLELSAVLDETQEAGPLIAPGSWQGDEGVDGRPELSEYPHELVARPDAVDRLALRWMEIAIEVSNDVATPGELGRVRVGEEDDASCAQRWLATAFGFHLNYRIAVSNGTPELDRD